MKVSKNNKSVNILVSVYNGGKTIERCMDSILCQTYPVEKIIVYDDASRDNTLNILKKYKAANPGLIDIYTSSINMGPGGGKNFILSKGSADYILFVDADDYIDKTYIYDAFESIDSDTYYDIIFTGFRGVRNNGEYIYKRTFKTAENALYSAISNWGKLYRLGFLRENNITIPGGRVLEDVLTRAVIIGNKPRVFLDKKNHGYNYVFNEKSVSHTYMNNFIEGVAEQELQYLYDNKNNINPVMMPIYYYWVYKIFCWHLLKSGSGVGSKKMETELHKLKNLLLDLFPNYTESKYLSYKKTDDRLLVQGVVKIMFLLDRLHLLTIAMKAYSAINLSFLWPRL